ncbi:hypothetical protein BVRB_021940, partial [Beta vulgaris subsp. vulgaris]
LYSHLKYTPYASTSAPIFKKAEQRESPQIPTIEPVQIEAVQQSTTGLRLTGVTRKWGPSGYGVVPANKASQSPKSESAAVSKAPQLNQTTSSISNSTTSAPGAVPRRSSSNDSMKEKEARAALLFGGTSKSSAPPAAASSNVSLPSARKMASTSTPARLPVAAQSPAIDDLLDIASLTSPNSAAAAASQPAFPTPNDPLTDLLFSLDPTVFPAASDSLKTANFQIPAYQLCSSFVNSPFATLARSSDDDVLLSHNDMLCASAFTVCEH